MAVDLKNYFQSSQAVKKPAIVETSKYKIPNPPTPTPVPPSPTPTPVPPSPTPTPVPGVSGYPPYFKQPNNPTPTPGTAVDYPPKFKIPNPTATPTPDLGRYIPASAPATNYKAPYTGPSPIPSATPTPTIPRSSGGPGTPNPTVAPRSSGGPGTPNPTVAPHSSGGPGTPAVKQPANNLNSMTRQDMQGGNTPSAGGSMTQPVNTTQQLMTAYGTGVGTAKPVVAGTSDLPAIKYGQTIGVNNIKDAKLQGADALGKLYGNYNYDLDSIKGIFTDASKIQGREGINAAQGVLNSSDQGYTQQMALARAAAEKERNSAVMSGASSGMQALAGMDTRAKADTAFANTRLEALQGIKTAQDKAASLNAKASTDAFMESQNANKQLMTTDSANYAVDASTQQAKLGYDAQVNAANTAGSASANNAAANVKAADITGQHNENAASITGNATLGSAAMNADSYKYSADKNLEGNKYTADTSLSGAQNSAKLGFIQAINDKTLNLTDATSVTNFNKTFGEAFGFTLPVPYTPPEQPRTGKPTMSNYLG